MPEIIEIIREARKAGASDVHIQSRKDANVKYRLHGRIIGTEFVATPDSIRAFVGTVFDQATQSELLKSEGAVDGAFEDEEFGPIRVHASKDLHGTRLAIRLLATSVARFSTLGLPAIILDLARRTSGLGLFVGPTGSGKSTAQASVLQALLETQSKHVVTLEDPIEYRLKAGTDSMVTQIEVGPAGQVPSFVAGLRQVLRLDPDIVQVGEARGPAEMAATLEVAEQGRLCFATVHARDASSVPDRIIGAFTADAQPQIRQQLANTLAFVVVLRLVPRKDGGGRVAAYELMIVDDAIRALIREGNPQQIRNALTTGVAKGNLTLEKSLSRLVGEGIVDLETAKEASVYPSELVVDGKALGDGANVLPTSSQSGGSRPATGVRPLF